MSFLSRATDYAESVVESRIVAGLFERLACKRFLDDLKRPLTPEFPYRLDEKKGSRICEFIELLPHIKGEWARPVYQDGRLQYAKLKLEDWQIFAEFQLFGWVHARTGLRRFRRCYEEVARKNAKSTRIAARDLFLLTADGEPGAQVYNAATTGDQAREVFDVARNMALRVPEFLARFGVDVGKHDITCVDTASSFKPLNAEGSTLDGLNVHAASIDELHAHKTRGVYDVLDTATGARSQPMVSMITTAGSDRSGICYEQRDYTIKVLQRTVIDESWFGIIYTIDDGDAWHDPAMWRKSNPNLGISVKLDDMEAACRKALATPSAQGNFLTKRLNVWVNADSAWLDMMAWDRCADKTLTLEKVKHLPCWIGLDLASTNDVAAKARWFYDAEADHHYLIPVFYLPATAVENGGNSQYDGWRRGGYLNVNEGNSIDFKQIEIDLSADMCDLLIREIPFDPWQATYFSTRMLARGAPMVEYRQILPTMSEPMKQFEALILSGKLTHDGNPMMSWMMSNVVCHLDIKDNIYPKKDRPQNKIDGPVASIMALGRCLNGLPSNAHDGSLMCL